MVGVVNGGLGRLGTADGGRRTEDCPERGV